MRHGTGPALAVQLKCNALNSRVFSLLPSTWGVQALTMAPLHRRFDSATIPRGNGPDTVMCKNKWGNTNVSFRALLIPPYAMG